MEYICTINFKNLNIMAFKLRGNRVLLDRPTLAKSSIELSPEAKISAEKELMEKFQKIPVFAVGPDVTDVTAGDLVYVPSNVLFNCDLVDFDGELKMLIAEQRIDIIW